MWLLEIACQFLLLCVIRYPGALIRWAIFRKRTYKEYLEDDLDYNAFPLVVISMIILLVSGWKLSV